MKSLLVFGMILSATLPNAAKADDCESPANQSEMTVCADLSFKKDDAAMNQVYAKLKTRYEKIHAAKDGLLNAQRAWLVFRDAECTLEAARTAGGTIQSMIQLQCLSRLTSLRTAQLQVRFDCEEGDLTCIPSGDAAN